MKSTNRVKEPVTFLLAKLFHFAGAQRKHIFTYCTLFVISNLIMLLGPYIFGMVVREIQQNGVTSTNFSYLMMLLSFLFLKELGFWAFHGVGRVIERMIAFNAENNYRKFLLKGVVNLSLGWHTEKDSGDLIDRINKATNSLFEFGQTIYNIVMIIVKLLGTCIVLLWFSPVIAISVLLFVLCSFIILFSFDRYLVPQYRGLNEFSNKASAALFDALSNISSVKILHIENPIVKGVMERFWAPKKLFRDNADLNEWKWFTGNMLVQIMGVVPVAYFIYDSLESGKVIDAGDVSTLYLYLTSLIWIFFTFGDLYEKFAIYANRVLNAEPLEVSIENNNKPNRKTILPWQELKIAQTSFSYGHDPNPTLNNISINIKNGQRIAVIGESGSGKTTFLKVLHGMYQEAHGQIQCDDGAKFRTNFADIDLKTMLVPQEPEIFSSTIRENITLALDFSDEQVMEMAKIASFAETINDLPRKLDSVINEKGVNLSGGQKQRLALTRALLFATHKDILLLDESTSSVDPDNEELIYQNIWQQFAQKTIIASIHKMNLLKFFDRIFIFDGGRIIDEGSFEDLLQRNKSFKTAWEKFVATK